jgi:hypothetical protein
MNVRALPFRVATQIRRRGLLNTIGKALDVMTKAWNVSEGLADYHLNPFALKESKLPPRDWARIRVEMEQAGLDVVPYRIDVTAFRDWLEEAAFPEYYVRSCGEVFIEKALEHYVSADLLQLRSGQVFVDVAASSSPWMSIASRLLGVTALAVDLKPPTAPVTGHKLAADATRLPFRDNSVDGMALHCAQRNV